MKGDGFQSAIICAHSFTLYMQHSGCTQGRLFFFHFHNFYGAPRSLHGVCFEFSLQCISDCFYTDLRVSDVAESSLSPVRHHDVARGGASGRIARTCQCRFGARPGCRKVRSEKRKGRGSEAASPAPPSRTAVHRLVAECSPRREPIGARDPCRGCQCRCVLRVSVVALAGLEGRRDRVAPVARDSESRRGPCSGRATPFPPRDPTAGSGP